MGTLNGITKLDSVSTFKVNADYSYHRSTHDISQSTIYLVNDGSYMTVNEQTSPLTETHLPKLSVNYERNADRMYLNERFVGKSGRNPDNILTNQQWVGQKRKASSFEVANNVI